MLYLSAAWLASGGARPVPEVAAVAGLLSFVKLLSYLRAFKPLAALVAVLAEVAKDSTPFLLILLIVLLAFSSAFDALDVFDSASAALYNTFMLGLGELFLEVSSRGRGRRHFRCRLLTTTTLRALSLFPLQDNNFSTPFRKALQIGCLLFVLVVMMNLLIALISDSFERVQEKAAAQFQFERANIIRDNNMILDALQRWFGDRWAEPPCRWLHVLRPKEGAGAGGASAASEQEWSGRMRGLKRSQKELAAATDAKIAKIAAAQKQTDAKIVAAQKQAADTAETVKADIAALTAKLDRLLSMAEQK